MLPMSMTNVCATGSGSLIPVLSITTESNAFSSLGDDEPRPNAETDRRLQMCRLDQDLLIKK
jgi:hypothetical protein